MSSFISKHNRLMSRWPLKAFVPGLAVLFVVSWFFAACAQQEEQATTAPVESEPSHSVLATETGVAKGSPDLRTAIIEVAQATIPSVVHIEVTQRQEIANPLVPFENNPLFRHFFGLPKDMPKKFIGVNAVIVSQSGGFEGIGFAIPSHMALYVAEQLIAHGKVERGWLGVSAQDLPPELATSFGVESTKGALIGDASTLRNQVAVGPIGQEVRLTILRDGKQQEVTVTIGNLEDATKMLAASVKERLAAEVRSLDAQETQKYGLGSEEGVAIASVDPNSPLGKAGFEIGDIILEINGEHVEGLDGFVSLVSTLKPDQKIALLALDHRSGNSGYVEVVVQ